MEVTIRPKNFKLSAGIEDQIRKRLDRLSRHIENLASAEVILSQQPTHLNPQRISYRAQVTLQTRHNNVVRSEVNNPELLTAIDQTMDHVTRQFERFKSRYERRKKGAVGIRHAAPATGADFAQEPPTAETVRSAPANRASPSPNGAYDDQYEGGRVVRVKRFTVTPMFPEDAIEEMELLGHNFYVFWNAADERVNVVYRRNDGNYGLIQPDLR